MIFNTATNAERELQNGTVLMIDDSKDDADLARLAFEQAGLQQTFLVITDPVEAVEQLNSSDELRAKLRMILLDFNMPRMNGIDVLRALQADSSLAVLPVVIMSTSDEPTERLATSEFKVHGHFQKPAVFSDFVSLASKIKHDLLD